MGCGCPNECAFSVSQFEGFSRGVFAGRSLFKIFLAQARKGIFSWGFLHLVHLNEIFQNRLVRVLDPPDPPARPLWP